MQKYRNRVVQKLLCKNKSTIHHTLIGTLLVKPPTFAACGSVRRQATDTLIAPDGCVTGRE